MTDALNEAFRRNPFTFVQNHDLAVNPQVASTSITVAGPANINLVMADTSITPKRVNIVKHASRRSSTRNLPT